jgi:AcrR family transcriptional regulator
LAVNSLAGGRKTTATILLVVAIAFMALGLLVWINHMLTNTIPRGQLKSAIVQYAMAYVEKNGYKDLNLDTVSRDLNVSHGAPYRHFKTKTDLLSSLALDGFTDLADTQTAFLARYPNGSREQMIALSEAYVDFLVRRERLYDVMWDFTWTPEINAQTAMAARRTFILHAETVKNYIDEQGLDPQLQDEMTMNIWAFLHGLGVLALHKPTIVQPSQERLNMLVRSGMNAMLDGYHSQVAKRLH